MATPPKDCHSPHMALQIWRTLIFGFWQSQDLVTESQTHLSSPETDTSSSCALHSPLHGRSSSALGGAQTDCQGWKPSHVYPLALKDTGQTALEEGQERRGLCLLLEVCCHLCGDTPLPVSGLPFLPPVVWSEDGPVFGVGVGPLFLIQLRLLESAWTHPQKSLSNVQAKLQSVGGAEHGAERKADVVERGWGHLFPVSSRARVHPRTSMGCPWTREGGQPRGSAKHSH